MSLLAAVTHSPGSPALSQFILSTASALTVVVLGYIARLMRRFMKEHEWLMETTKENSAAIRQLMEDHKPKPQAQSRRR